MKFTVSVKQEGGLRDYVAANVNLPDNLPQPINQQQANRLIIGMVSSMEGHLIRASGAVYMLGLVEPGSRGLEIGVDKGDGIARLLTRTVAHVTGVDPYLAVRRNAFESDDKAVMDQRWADVCRRFRCEVENGTVSLVRADSHEYLESSPGEPFDWIYVDGDHTYKHAKKDLELSWKNLRPGGHLFVDDAHDIDWGQGVSRAVAEFQEAHEDAECLWAASDPVVFRKR